MRLILVTNQLHSVAIFLFSAFVKDFTITSLINVLYSHIYKQITILSSLFHLVFYSVYLRYEGTSLDISRRSAIMRHATLTSNRHQKHNVFYVSFAISAFSQSVI